jgi:hypothetical protein
LRKGRLDLEFLVAFRKAGKFHRDARFLRGSEGLPSQFERGELNTEATGGDHLSKLRYVWKKAWANGENNRVAPIDQEALGGLYPIDPAELLLQRSPTIRQAIRTIGTQGSQQLEMVNRAVRIKFECSDFQLQSI